MDQKSKKSNTTLWLTSTPESFLRFLVLLHTNVPLHKLTVRLVLIVAVVRLLTHGTFTLRTGRRCQYCERPRSLFILILSSCYHRALWCTELVKRGKSSLSHFISIDCPRFTKHVMKARHMIKIRDITEKKGLGWTKFNTLALRNFTRLKQRKKVENELVVLLYCSIWALLHIMNSTNTFTPLVESDKPIYTADVTRVIATAQRS